MSDTRLRELERRWRTSGSDEDEAAYLLERVRVGDMPRIKLQRLAAFRHPAAGIAVSNDRTRAAVASDASLFRTIAAFGGEPLKRAALTCAVEALPAWYANPLSDRVHPHEMLAAGVRSILALSYATSSMVTDYNNRACRLASDADLLLGFDGIRQVFRTGTPAQHRSLRAIQSCVLAIRTIICPEPERLNLAEQTYTHSLIACAETDRPVRAMCRDLIAWELGNDPLASLPERLRDMAEKAAHRSPP